MRRVADEEHVIVAEAIGNLCCERERIRSFDAREQAGESSRRRDHVAYPVVGVVRQPFASRVPRDAVQPAIITTGGQQRPDNLRVGDRVEDIAVCADQVPQRRTELKDDPLVQVVVSDHADSEGVPNRATCAVGRDHIPGFDRARLVAHDVAKREA